MTITAQSVGAAVRVAGVVKQYKDSRALDGVDLDIKPGE